METDEIEEEIYAEGDSMDIDSDEEFEISAFGLSADDDLFDTVVGRIEEIVMSDEFNQLQQRFVQLYSHEFTSDEENKLIYMEIFQKYQLEIEKYIERNLSDVNMARFMAMLMQRQHEIDGPLFEMLLSFSDFQVFKELMLSYSAANDLEIAGTASIIHTDEVMDGDEVADLGLIIKSVKSKK